MTLARFALALSTLTLALGCAEAAQIEDAEGATAKGGSTGMAATSVSTTIAPAGGAAPAVTTAATSGLGGTTGQTAPTTVAAVAPVTCAGTDELTMLHTPQGGNGVAGTTIVSVGTLTSFNADDLDLKLCFGTIPATGATINVASMKIYYAAIEGMSSNVPLTATTVLSETTTDGRYCLVFDVGSAAGTTDFAVSGTGTVKYNWNFDTTNLGSGVMLDPRPGSEPQLLAVLNESTAACTKLAP